MFLYLRLVFLTAALAGSKEAAVERSRDELGNIEYMNFENSGISSYLTLRIMNFFRENTKNSYIQKWSTQLWAIAENTATT